MPRPSVPAGFSTVRARTYVLRLPLFTRAIITIIILFWLLGIQSVWDIRSWGALVPNEIGFTTGEAIRATALRAVAITSPNGAPGGGAARARAPAATRAGAGPGG